MKDNRLLLLGSHKNMTPTIVHLLLDNTGILEIKLLGSGGA